MRSSEAHARYETDCPGPKGPKGPRFQGAKGLKRQRFSEESRGRDLRLFANRQETAGGKPAAVEPREAEATLGTVLVETRHAAAAIDLRDGAEADYRRLPLLLGILGPVSEDVFDLGWLPGVRGIGGLDLGDGILRRDILAKVEEGVFEFNLPFPDDREAFGRDVIVLPIVAAGRDHDLKQLAIVHDVGAGFGWQRAEAERCAHREALGEVRARVEEIGQNTAFQAKLERIGDDPLLLQKEFEFATLLGGVDCCCIDAVHVEFSSMNAALSRARLFMLTVC